MEHYLLNKKKKLEESVKSLKNSIFFKEEEIKNLKSKLQEEEKKLRETKNELIEICDHEWEVDFIDSMKGYKLSQRIRYCLKCELTDCTSPKAT